MLPDDFRRRLVQLIVGAAGAGEPEIGPKGSKFEPGSRITAPGPEMQALGPGFRARGAEIRFPGSNCDPLGPTSGSPASPGVITTSSKLVVCGAA